MLLTKAGSRRRVEHEEGSGGRVISVPSQQAVKPASMTTLILEKMQQLGVDCCIAVCNVRMSAGEGEAGVRLDQSERPSLHQIFSRI
jgi:hypothetical protein